MVLSELRTWVGLSAADAVSLFEERVGIEPHWGGRWGLKPSATEAILRAQQSDPSGASAKELEAHEIVFTPVRVLNLVVS
ncbi:unnamed protein product [Cladocopium goreaui]|uniref:Uncharacterized protein n=1 Tax=Cladocopium goreaui TaxID=2562237 RepID=A0A9P1CHM0_9DINO|nr:unnamed protein product [Cladocopium goreaui]